MANSEGSAHLEVFHSTDDYRSVFFEGIFDKLGGMTIMPKRKPSDCLKTLL